MSSNTPEGRGVGEARRWDVLGGLREGMTESAWASEACVECTRCARACASLSFRDTAVTISVYERAKSWRLELE